ncbi:MAG: hypothetical protein FWG30_11665 [Eubacteriaceae bacterium]|nr:hypothetical protein [Eubacteriaceae bacterium]
MQARKLFEYLYASAVKTALRQAATAVAHDEKYPFSENTARKAMSAYGSFAEYLFKNPDGWDTDSKKKGSERVRKVTAAQTAIMPRLSFIVLLPPL